MRSTLARHIRFAFASLPLVMAAAACDDTVHVRLTHSDDLVMLKSCSLALAKMASFYAELERPQEKLWNCIDLDRAPKGIAELEGLLAERMVFERVSTGGGWTIWVEGFLAPGCEKRGAPLLCGNEENVSIDGSSEELWINVGCVVPEETCKQDPDLCKDAHVGWEPGALASCRKP